MKKSIIGGILALSMVLPFAASAATLDSTAVFNGQENVWGTAGQNKTATLRLSAVAGEVVHAYRTRVDNQASACKAIAPFEGVQTKDVPVSIVLPPNSGTNYNFQVDVFTTTTLPEAQSLTGDLACTGSYTTVYNQNSVNVNPSGSNPSDVSTIGGFGSFAELVAALKLALTPATPAPAPVSTACTQLALKSAGSVFGVYNDANVKLQGFLLSEGASIPALKAGASFGFRGPQTEAAVSAFKIVNSCN